MSWQAYVDSNLVGTNLVAEAAIVGLQGGVWAKSANLNLSDAEQKAVIKVHSDVTSAQAKGLVLAGQKFFAIQANERSFYGKKGADGCIVVKTTQAVLVAIYRSPVQAPEATPIVEKLADYLIGVGY